MAAALLLLIFNRPDLTERVFSRIRDYRPAKLYVAADGPRESKANEAKDCELSRAATENIDWPCEVQRLYRSENLGCKAAVSSAITWFFEHEPEGIILEDDCLPDLSFFHFAEEMLDRYRDEPQVMSIASCNLFPKTAPQPYSYYFSKYPNIWGWATWRRVWANYDVALSGWPATRDQIRRRVTNRAAMNHFAGAFDSIKAGNMDTWDYQLVHSLLLHGGLTIYSHHNLTANIGFGEKATHTVAGDSPTLTRTVQPLEFPLRHPPAVVMDELMSSIAERPFMPEPIFRRCIRKIERLTGLSPLFPISSQR